MSRTDKDTPHWVTAAWWKPWHEGCVNAPANDSIGAHEHPYRECDLPEVPDIKQHRMAFTRGRCTWTPGWERHHYPNPPHWYVNRVWTSRERLAARVGCLNAAKEYRGSGQAFTDPTTRQNRHCAQSLWP